MFDVGEIYRYDTSRQEFVDDAQDWVAIPQYLDIVIMGKEQYNGHRYLLQFMRIGDGSGDVESFLVHPGMISKFKLLENPEDAQL